MNHEPCQDAFVHPKFALELAALLEEATSDTMTLQTLCGGVALLLPISTRCGEKHSMTPQAAMGEELRERTSRHVNIVMVDMLKIQREGDDMTSPISQQVGLGRRGGYML